MCVRERERVCVCQRERESVCVCDKERECVLGVSVSVLVMFIVFLVPREELISQVATEFFIPSKENAGATHAKVTHEELLTQREEKLGCIESRNLHVLRNCSRRANFVGKHLTRHGETRLQ